MTEALLIKNIKGLAQILDKSVDVLKGDQMKNLPILNDAFLLLENGIIGDFGSMDNCPNGIKNQIDARGKYVLPAWCDSHSHIVYAGSREQEFVGRINGQSYEEIAENGGGILNSAQRLASVSEDELYECAMERLNEMIGYGAGAIEIKSGYGLSYESELKMLRVIKRLKENTDAKIKATFLGAHAIPCIYKNDRQAYIDIVIHKMLPAIAKEGLADYCDVFCDKGFYTMEETDQILQAAQKYGLKAKIHANELANSGGVQIGVKNEAISVDHLECIGEKEIQTLAESNTMPTLLPSTAFFLNLEYAPARAMLDAGLPIALATDYNPGSTPSGKMAFVLSLACIKMKMTPEEAINGATINGAKAMELSQDYGSITKGKVANIIITKKIPSLAFLPYAFGSDLTDIVILKGKVQNLS